MEQQMSPELGESILAEADRKAELEKAQISYVIDLIEQNEDFYRSAFLSHLDSDEQTDLALYNEVVKGIRQVKSNAARVIGGIVYRRTPIQVEAETSQDALLRVGWMRFSEPSASDDEIVDPDAYYAYVQLPTKLGVQIVDEWRVAGGESTIAEMRAAERKAWGFSEAVK